MRWVVLVLLWAGSAHAYVRSRSSSGTPVYWPSSCVFLTPDQTGTQDLQLTTVVGTIEKSMSNWMTLDASSAYLQLEDVAPAPVQAHYDGRNVITFVSGSKFCHPEDAMSHNLCFPDSAAAITTAYFVDKPGDPRDGELLDADIELNDVNFTFAVLPTDALPRSGTRIVDLENTLTHELGHLQGLDHTCADSATPPNAVDETGHRPPICEDCDHLNLLPAKITSATMYNSACDKDIAKRSPEADDVAGIAAIYPIAKDPKVCSTDPPKPPGAGCALEGRPEPNAIWPLFLAFSAFCARRIARC